MSTCIYYVDALCGAGKTFAALKWAFEQAKNGESICFVQPTIKLIGESINQLKIFDINEDIFIHEITTSSVPKDTRVIEQLDDFLKSMDPSRTILFITQSTFEKIKYFHNQKSWTIIFDEIPRGVIEISPHVSKSTSKYLNDLEDIDFNTHISEIFIPKSKHTLLRPNNANLDESIRPYKDLIDYLNNDKFKVLVDKESLSSYRKQGNKKQFIAVAFFDFIYLSKFKQTIILGAFFKESIFHQCIKIYNTKNNLFLIKEHSEIVNNLRTSIFSDKFRNLTIYYAFEQNWSKYLYEKQDLKLNKSHILLYAEAISTFFKDVPFIYSSNKTKNNYNSPNFNSAIIANRDVNIEEIMSNGERVSGLPHGQNNYQTYTNAAYLTSNNPSPAYFKLLDMLGISDEIVKSNTYYQNCYQFIMRTSLRNPNCKKDVTIIVPDKGVADFLGLIFPNSKISKLPNIHSIDSSPKFSLKGIFVKSPVLKNLSCNRNKMIDEVLTLNVNQQYINNSNNLTLNSNKFDYPISISSSNSVTKLDLCSKITFGIYYNFKERTPFKHLQLSIKQFLEFLKNEHENSKTRNYLKKDQQNLISTTVFENNKRDSKSIKHTFGIWLDIDGGDLSYKKLFEILDGLYILAFNTYTAEKNRYRIFIPTDNLLTDKAYKDITKSIIEQIEFAGFSIPKNSNENMGNDTKLCFLDRTKCNAASIFYMPTYSNLPFDKKFNFFHVQEGSFLDVMYYLHNPLHNCVEYDVRSYSKNIKTNCPTGSIKMFEEKRNNLVETYIEDYRKIIPSKGLRHLGFFVLALKLTNLGLTLQEVESYLHFADYDFSRGEKRIKDCIKSLIRYNKIPVC